MPATPPSPSDDALFIGTLPQNQPTLTADRSINSLIFSTPTGGWHVNLSTFALTITGSNGISAIGQTSGTSIISGSANPAIITTSVQTWSVGYGGTLTINASVKGGQNIHIGAGNVNVTSTASVDQLITLSFAIAGFLASLYALMRGDSRLKPDATRTFYAIAVAIIVGTLALISKNVSSANWQNMLYLLSLYGFVLIICLVLIVFYRAYVRITFFHQGSGSWKFFWPILWYRSTFNNKKKGYVFAEVHKRKEWDQTTFLKNLLTAAQLQQVEKGGSILIKSSNLHDLRNEIMPALTKRLECGDSANYVTCAQTPGVLYEAHIKTLDKKYTAKFVIVDVFSPTFGFSEDILLRSKSNVETGGYKIFEANSLGALHAAVKAAFKYIRGKQDGVKERFPCIMIYDSISRFEFIEGAEPLTVFLHHMVPAERSYNMVTVLLEHEFASESIIRVMESLVDIVVTWPPVVPAADQSNPPGMLQKAQ